MRLDDQNCPTCGASVAVEGDAKEGTFYYVPRVPPIADDALAGAVTTLSGYSSQRKDMIIVAMRAIEHVMFEQGYDSNEMAQEVISRLFAERMLK